MESQHPISRAGIPSPKYVARSSGGSGTGSSSPRISHHVAQENLKVAPRYREKGTEGQTPLVPFLTLTASPFQRGDASTRVHIQLHLLPLLSEVSSVSHHAPPPDRLSLF